LEGVAVLHNDCFLPIDELSQVAPAEAGEIAYMLGNGIGKVRAGRDGLSRAAVTWRTLFLSTGEVSLEDHLLQIGKRTKAGQKIRMADIPADAGKSLGIFENLHDCKDGAALSRSIVKAVRHSYGTAGPAFIEAIVGKLDMLPIMIDAMRKEFIAEVLGVDEVNHGQVIRVAERFALVAVAGELATNLGITGWKPHDAENAVKSCFTAWFDARESGGDLDATAILSQVKGFFEEHGESRFTSLDDDFNHATNRRAGFSRDSDGGTEFIVLPEVFKSEICSGFNATTVTKILIEQGWLVTGSDGKAQVRETLPGIGRARCYVFNAAMWAH
jgi:putative DNA primase/helicase